MSASELKESYDNACNKYAQLFAEKHDLEFDCWINYDNIIGGLASFSDSYYFTMENIKLDIDRNVPKGEAVKWHEHSLAHAYTCQGDLNYFSYLLSKGFLKK